MSPETVPDDELQPDDDLQPDNELLVDDDNPDAPVPASTEPAISGEEPAGHLPTFVIIGAQKSATRWLRLNLGQHPDIYTAPLELRYFNDGPSFRQGSDFYARQFTGWDGEPIVGEATPGYMIWRHTPSVVATRMRRFNPGLKVVAILRNPIDRAYSGLVHHMRRERLAPDTDLLTYVQSKAPETDRLCLVSGGWYHASLDPFRQRFNKNLLILLHDDVIQNPRAVYAQALAHVGADPSFVPPELAEVRFSNTPPKHSGLRRQTGSGYRELTVAQRYALWEYFEEDVAQLEQMMDRDLSMWRPARPPH